METYGILFQKEEVLRISNFGCLKLDLKAEVHISELKALSIFLAKIWSSLNTS